MSFAQVAAVATVDRSFYYVMAPSTSGVEEAIFNIAPEFSRRMDMKNYLILLVRLDTANNRGHWC